MFQREIVVRNKTGFHSRPAADLAEICQTFDSEITIIKDKEVINGKSVISILSGGIYQGTKIKLEIEGEDEDAAGFEIVSFIENLTE